MAESIFKPLNIKTLDPLVILILNLILDDARLIMDDDVNVIIKNADRRNLLSIHSSGKYNEYSSIWEAMNISGIALTPLSIWVKV
jgi:hypothetical protein